MNIKDLHMAGKAVSAISIFKDGSNATALRILTGEILKEHITKVPAVLICIEGKALFENEQGMSEILFPGDYVNIEPMLKHWVKGIEDTQLILFK